MQERPNFVEQLIPFLIIGVAIALLIGVFIMLSYALVWGLLIGAILWGIVRIKAFFKKPSAEEKTSGRIIEHDNDDK